MRGTPCEIDRHRMFSSRGFIGIGDSPVRSSTAGTSGHTKQTVLSLATVPARIFHECFSPEVPMRKGLLKVDCYGVVLRDFLMWSLMPASPSWATVWPRVACGRQSRI